MAPATTHRSQQLYWAPTTSATTFMPRRRRLQKAARGWRRLQKTASRNRLQLSAVCCAVSRMLLR
eukprot:12837380-Alexandrium_andersonii.AAC.1